MTINCVYYNEFIRCFRNGVIERFWRNKYWQEIENKPNTKFGYNQIKINREMKRRHRVIAFCFLGLEDIKCKKDNSNSIDHIDGNRINNAVNNLRIVSHSENIQNMKSMNGTEIKGYSWDKKSKKYKAMIISNKKRIYLGYFDTKEKARNAYLKAKEKYHII